MKRLKKFSSMLSIVLVLQLLLPGLLTTSVQAAGSDPVTFSKVESRPVKTAIRYKDKTIVLDYYVNYDQVVDPAVQLIVEAAGNKNIVSQDAQLLRGFVFIGIQNDFAYFADDYNAGRYIYKVDLNNYTLQKTDESVNSYSKDVNVGVRDAVMDSNGTKWFADDNPYWNFRDASGNIIENARALLVYNSLGKFTAYKISSRVIDNYEGVGHITPGNDGDVWFTYSFIKDSVLNTRDNKIVRVTKDGIVEEYPIDSNCYIDDIRVDKSGNVYLKANNWVKQNYSMVKTDGMVMHYTFANGSLQHLKDYPVQDAYFTDMDLDANGSLWILDGAKPMELESGIFNLKYYTLSKMNEFSVYDDNNMVTYCFNYGYTNITMEPGTDSQSPTGESGSGSQSTGSTDGQPSDGGSSSGDSSGSNTPSNASQNQAGDILSSDKISKDALNEVSAVISNGSAQVKFDAENVKGGQGSLKLDTDKMLLELPFGAIDFTGIEANSYIGLRENIISNASIPSSLNAIGRIFDFSLATYKSDGTLIKDIHSFVSGKAKISIKLTADDIKNLDTSKLAAYYYNETTKNWELIGGTFDKKTMVFSFETTHFSKYTIAQTSSTLPQTGSFADTTGMILLSIILIGLGAILAAGKTARE